MGDIAVLADANRDVRIELGQATSDDTITKTIKGVRCNDDWQVGSGVMTPWFQGGSIA